MLLLLPAVGLNFYWPDDNLEPFEVRFTPDPETFEYSIKPVPLAWFTTSVSSPFWRSSSGGFLRTSGLRPSIAHGGGQFSLSANTFLVGSLLADDIAYKLNHPELQDGRPSRGWRGRLGLATRPDERGDESL
jgi:hypothetical protein